jgi:hypothetical protein
LFINKILYLDVIILIIDEPRQRTIAEHRFPWRWLEPFFQYHLNLHHTLKQTSLTTNLYISIMRKQSTLSKEDIRYFGLEILLNRFDVPIPKKQVLFAVARVIPDYETYKYVSFFSLLGECVNKLMKWLIYIYLDMIIYGILIIQKWVLTLKNYIFHQQQILIYRIIHLVVILKHH